MLKPISIFRLAALTLILSACHTAPVKPPELPKPVAPIAPITPPVVVTPPAVTPPTPTLPKLPVKPTEAYKPVEFSALPGWQQDDLREAWPAFIGSCNALRFKPEWAGVCDVAKGVDANDAGALRSYFELLFTPYQVATADGVTEGLVTGYYEPLLTGSRQRGGKFQTPLYKAPADLLTVELASIYPELKTMRLRGRVVGNKLVPYASRAQVLEAARGNEIVWVDDVIDGFFLEIQGSGRVFLPETNETIRVAYADQNGHPYKSIGRYLIDKGELKLENASAQGIRAWIQKNPARQDEVLNANPSVVFFKEEKILDPSIGPKGALGVPLTAQRSIAVDPQFVTLGAPVFLSTTQPNSSVPLQRLVVAQDTGGAIRGAVRADYFWGFGHQAGEQAGRMKQRGSMMWLLLPKGFDTGVK
jgi:membrane-bound lytic murein transglycosylase A